MTEDDDTRRAQEQAAYFRTLPIDLQGTRSTLELTLTSQWTALRDERAELPLPPQEWAAAVGQAVGETYADNRWDTDLPARAQLILRLINDSGADLDGDVVLRAFQLEDFAAVGLTVTVSRPTGQPGWLDGSGGGQTMDEAATAAHAEPAIVSTSDLPRVLRLARDGRSGDVTPALLIALAAQDRPTEEKDAEMYADAQAILEDTFDASDYDDTTDKSAEIWLTYQVPVPRSESVLTLSFRGYGDFGMDAALGEASDRVADLAFGGG